MNAFVFDLDGPIFDGRSAAEAAVKAATEQLAGADQRPSDIHPLPIDNPP